MSLPILGNIPQFYFKRENGLTKDSISETLNIDTANNRLVVGRDGTSTRKLNVKGGVSVQDPASTDEICIIRNSTDDGILELLQNNGIAIRFHSNGISFLSDALGVGTSAPDASSLFEVSSTTRGMISPRVTSAQQTAIVAPATGLQVYNTDRNLLEIYNGIVWGSVCSHYGQDDIPTVVVVAAINTDYIIDGMVEQFSNGMTFQNNQESKCLIAGKYLVNWSVSLAMVAGANQDIEGAVGINGVRQPLTSAHRLVAGAADAGCLTGTGIVTLAIDDLLQIVIRNETAINNISIEHANLSALQIF